MDGHAEYGILFMSAFADIGLFFDTNKDIAPRAIRHTTTIATIDAAHDQVNTDKMPWRHDSSKDLKDKYKANPA